ncbi:MAG: FAD-dependent oxidoreductase [bacterium]|nr:FAD-dependent oxidoreductase [Candidatus Kapabacteria bacterium]
MSIRKRLVILGSGFAAFMILKKIDVRHYDVTIISPRNHFLFTPLLPSTTVGTVELRSIIEPIRKARRGTRYIQAEALALDIDARSISCRGHDIDSDFSHEYDYLAIAIGADNNTFGIPGVAEHAVFLKELSDARAIREKIISCLERADLPHITNERREQLLHFVVVGGGPTGVELAAELNDLLDEDLNKSYPNLVGLIRISLYEAMETILTTFDEKLREYTMAHFARQGIELHLQSPVAEVGSGYLKLKSGEVIQAELIVWSTGYAPRSFVRSLPFETERSGRILTDEYLRVIGHEEIFALGDCATYVEGPLPQTAQAAMQAGKFLGTHLNSVARGKSIEPFHFKNLGMLAYVGDHKALADIPGADIQLRGETTYFFWRSAYLTRLVSLKNKVLVLFDWIKARLFGRDLSKF